MSKVSPELLSAAEIAEAQAEGSQMGFRACSDCRFWRRDSILSFSKCVAFGGGYADRTRDHLCRGTAWARKPLRHPGAFERLWRFMFGYRPG